MNMMLPYDVLQQHVEACLTSVLDRLRCRLVFGWTDEAEELYMTACTDAGTRVQACRDRGLLTELLRMLCIRRHPRLPWRAVVPNDAEAERVVHEAAFSEDLLYTQTVADSFGGDDFLCHLVGGDTYSLYRVISLIVDRDMFVGDEENENSAYVSEQVDRIRIAILTEVLSYGYTYGYGKQKKSLRALRFLIATRRLDLAFVQQRRSKENANAPGRQLAWRARASCLEDADRFGCAFIGCVKFGDGDLAIDMVAQGFVDIRQIRDLLAHKSTASAAFSGGDNKTDLCQTMAEIAAETWQPRALEFAVTELGARADPSMLVSACRPSALFPGTGIQDRIEVARQRAGGVPAGRRVVQTLRHHGVGDDAWRIVAERQMHAYGLRDPLLLEVE